MNANEKQTITLPAGNVLTITAAAGVTGLVVRLPQSPGGGDAQSVTPIAGANLTFGAYAQPERFEISCTAGSLTVSQAVPVPDTDATMAGNSDHVVPTQKAVKTAIAQGVAGVDTLDELLPATAENDVIVAGPSPFTWVKKTIAQFKTILGLGTAAYTAATAYDAAGTAAGLVAGKADKVAASPDPTGYIAEFDSAGNLVKSSKLSSDVHASGSDDQDLSGYAPIDDATFTGVTEFETLVLPSKTPINATGTTLTLPVADLAILEVGDTIVFEEVTCTKAVAAGAGEFNSAAELAALLNAIEGWTGAEDTGIVTAVSAALGAAENGTLATITHLGATTSGGSTVAKAGAKLLAAELARLAVGDTVTFDGSTFTKAAATSVPAGEFADVAGLILCIDGMTNWTAVLSGSDIDIEAADVGESENNKIVNLIYYRASAGALDGTVGVVNEICADASYYYISFGESLVSTQNWRRFAKGSAY